MSRCVVCHRMKQPIGRDVAAAMADSLCTLDCPGYEKAPHPGTSWPGESDINTDSEGETDQPDRNVEIARILEQVCSSEGA
jgi:hypothetical protein